VSTAELPVAPGDAAIPAPVEVAEDRGPFARLLLWPAEKFRRATAPMDPLPLLLLFLLFLADEFDTGAFAALAPDIQRAFRISDSAFVSLVGVNVALVILLAIPVGWWADRTNRVRLVWLSAVVAVVFSALTGFVPAGAVALLVLVRLGNGIGLVANDPVHTSLLADYYTPDSRPEVFSIHRTAPRIGAILGPVVAGLIGAALGWRAAFFIMAIPVVFVVIATLKLEEPRRGATDLPAGAAGPLPAVPTAEADEPPVSFRAAVKMLWAIRTLRRQYLADIFLGGAFIPLQVFLLLYLDRVFHQGPQVRGLVGAVIAAGLLVGVQWSGRLTRHRWLPKGVGTPQKWAGYSILLVGGGLVVVAALNVLAAVVVVGFLVAVTAGLYFPSNLTITALVSPARIRSQSFSFSALFFFMGAIFFPIAGAVSDKFGIRWGIASLTPLWLVAGVLLWSAHRFVEDDINNAWNRAG
jgi:MFS family permease